MEETIYFANTRSPDMAQAKETPLMQEIEGRLANAISLSEEMCKGLHTIKGTVFGYEPTAAPGNAGVGATHSDCAKGCILEQLSTLTMLTAEARRLTAELSSRL